MKCSKANIIFHLSSFSIWFIANTLTFYYTRWRWKDFCGFCPWLLLKQIRKDFSEGIFKLFFNILRIKQYTDNQAQMYYFTPNHFCLCHIIYLEFLTLLTYLVCDWTDIIDHEWNIHIYSIQRTAHVKKVISEFTET